MNTQDIWSIAGAIIASIGGAGVIICAVSGFVCNRIAKHLDAKYEQRLNKELEKYKVELERNRHITKTQFDKEFEIYHQLSKSFLSMIVKLSSFTEGTLELKDAPKENRDIKINEFMRMVEVTSAAQNALYENAAFIPKDIFEQYDVIYSKANSKAVNLLSEKGIYTLEELDAALSVVHDKASEIRNGMKPREMRIRQLQKLMEQAQNLRETQPIHDECKQIRWKGKQEKFAEAHRADLAIWDAANRYLRANLPDMKLTPKAWQTELAALTAENEAEYARLKAQREEVTELQKVRRYVDVALKADAPQKAKNKHHGIDR